MRCRVCKAKMVLFDELSQVTDGALVYRRESFQVLFRHFHLMTELARCRIRQKDCMNCASILTSGGGRQKFIEIGCGSGIFLREAEKYFSKCVGIEPSHTARDARNSCNAHVINDYFQAGLGLEKEYAAFAALEVFEHL